MGVLDGLEPQAVFRHFEELTQIPHGSGHTRAISDHVAAFARARGLETLQDDAGNLLVTLPASRGRESCVPLMLQGHLDMVAVKTPTGAVDPAKDPLRLVLDGEYIRAQDTSLGADDGIAIAYFMALMEDPGLQHPCVYLLMTIDEETGMDGAAALDPAWLKTPYFINIDSEEEGVFLAGCAGGGRAHITLPCALGGCSGRSVTITVSGLKGGHSGMDIHKGRGNACRILGSVLTEIVRPVHAVHGAPLRPRISAIRGGVADNAIPDSAGCTLIGVTPAEEDRIRMITAAVQDNWRVLLADTDPGLVITVSDAEERSAPAADGEFTETAGRILKALPNGVRSMSPDMPGLVQTSLNLGVLRLETDGEKGFLHLDLAVRSSVTAERDALLGELERIAGQFTASFDTHGLYPGWQYNPDSVIIAHLAETWRTVFSREPGVQAIHAGVECGLFKEKRPDLDCVSFGPDLENVHSVNERMHIGSAARTWNFLLAVLENWQVTTV